MVQQTSLSAYEEIKSKLGKRQAEVMSLLSASEYPLANREIAKILNREINTITPRVKELRELGLVESFGIKIINGRRNLAWWPVSKQQGELF